ncbi:dTDP-4-dehydrorhamnose reductase [compost metagenome]
MAHSSKLRVLVTGGHGQLGRDVVDLLTKKGYEAFPVDREEMDITDFECCQQVMNTIKPHIVIHAAAYTAVDQAESDRENAFLINAYGTRNVAVMAQQLEAKLIYISTDYVFSGEGTMPRDEFHAVSPINVYGASKLAGEQFVKELHQQYFIVRTSWVYGQHGNNFVKTMLNLAKQRQEISVVHDQIGCPTYTIDLAATIIDLMQSSKYGTYHVSNSGQCSWYEFATAIFELSGSKATVVPVHSDSFPRPAVRPAFSVFDHMALRINGFTTPRPWREALEDFLRN